MADLPLLKDAIWGIRADVLGHESAARTLTHAIRVLPHPACIAVYGSWGAGKTTFLNTVYENWKNKGAAVWFDPWEHEQRADVVSPLLHAIVSYAEETKRADILKLRALAEGIAKTLWSLGVQVGAHWLSGDKDKLKPLADLKADDLTKHFASWSAYHSEINGIKKDFKDLVDLVLGSKPDGCLLIFLDDLDRCLPDSVIKLLEGVKLLLCGQEDCRVMFVFGLDRQIVGEAIAQRYPTSSVYSGESYLEKIFDLSLEVPAASPKQIEKLLDQVWPPPLANAVAEAFEPFGGKVVVSGALADAVFANPRVIKRALNRLILFARSGGIASLPTDLRADGESATRFLSWVAGAERFRGFRYAFMDATPREISGLHDFVRSGDEKGTSDRLLRIARTPGFRRYYGLIGLEKGDGAAAERQREVTDQRKAPGPPSLRDFDDALRSVGL